MHQLANHIGKVRCSMAGTGAIMMRTTTTTIIHIKGRVRRAHYQRRVQTPLLPSSQRVRGTSFRRRYPQASYFKQPGRSVQKPWRRRPPSAPRNDALLRLRRKLIRREGRPSQDGRGRPSRKTLHRTNASRRRLQRRGPRKVPKPKPVSSSSQPSLYLIDGQKIRCPRSGVGSSSSLTPYVRPVEWHGQDLWSVGERYRRRCRARPAARPEAPPVRSPPASPDRVGVMRGRRTWAGACRLRTPKGD